MKNKLLAALATGMFLVGISNIANATLTPETTSGAIEASNLSSVPPTIGEPILTSDPGTLTVSPITTTINSSSPENSSIGEISGSVEYSTSFPPTNSVPEPATMLLLGTGIAGLIAARRKKTA